MSIGETEVLTDIITRLDALERAVVEDAALMGTVPQSLPEFEAMSAVRRSGSRALMKSFEQLEDQLARSFRLVPTLLGINTDGWYMKDFANFMEKNGIVENAGDWMEIVKLRNRLVHDYPVHPVAQYDKLADVISRVPALLEIRRRLLAFISYRGLSA